MIGHFPKGERFVKVEGFAEFEGGLDAGVFGGKSADEEDGGFAVGILTKPGDEFGAGEVGHVEVVDEEFGGGVGVGFDLGAGGGTGVDFVDLMAAFFEDMAAHFADGGVVVGDPDAAGGEVFSSFADGMEVGLFAGEGEGDIDDGANGGASGDFEGAIEAGDDAEDAGEFGAEILFKKGSPGGGDGGLAVAEGFTGVGEGEAEAFGFAMGGGKGFGADDELAAIGHGVEGAVDEVEDDLMDGSGGGDDGVAGGVEVEGDVDVASDAGAEEGKDGMDAFVEGDPLFVFFADEGGDVEDFLGEAASALGGFGDAAKGLGGGFGGGFTVEEEGGVAEDDGEEVIEVMGHAFGEGTEGVEAFGLEGLGVEFCGAEMFGDGVGGEVAGGGEGLFASVEGGTGEDGKGGGSFASAFEGDAAEKSDFGEVVVGEGVGPVGTGADGVDEVAPDADGVEGFVDAERSGVVDFGGGLG